MSNPDPIRKAQEIDDLSGGYLTIAKPTNAPQTSFRTVRRAYKSILHIRQPICLIREDSNV